MRIINFCFKFVFLFLVVASISRAAEFQPPEGVKLLGPDELKATFVGNTVVGRRGWKEFYAENGEILGKNNQGHIYQGRWMIEPDRMCYSYHSGGADTCSFIGSDADGVIRYYDVDRGNEKRKCACKGWKSVVKNPPLNSAKTMEFSPGREPGFFSP